MPTDTTDMLEMTEMAGLASGNPDAGAGPESPPSRTSGKRRVIKNTLYMGGAQVVSLLVSLVAFPLFLKHYGTSIYGLFLLVSTVASVITLFDFGTTSIITKEVARHLALDDEEGLSRTVFSSFVFYGVLALLTAAVFVFIGCYAHTFFSVTVVQGQLLRLMFFVQAGVQLLTFAVWPARPILAGFQRYGILAVGNILNVIGSTLAIIFVLVTGRGPLVLVALSGLFSVAVAGVLMVALLKTLPRHPLSLRAVKAGPQIRALLKLGLPLFLVQMTGFLIRQQSDKLIIGVFLSAAAVSLYEIPSKLFSLASQIVDTSTGSLLPYLSGLSARGEHERLQNTFIYGSRYLSLLICPLLGLIFIMAPTFVHIWLGPQFAVAGTIARILLAVPLLWPFTAIGDSILISMDKMSKWMPLALLAGVISIVLSLCLVRPFGLTGVAAASFFGGFLELVFYIPLFFHLTKTSFSGWLKSALVPGLISIALCWCLSLLAQRVFVIPSLWILAALSAAVLIIVWLVVWLIIMNRSERAMILQWVGRSKED